MWFFARVSAVLFLLSVPSAFVAVLISCSAPVAAQEFKDCTECPTMVVVPAGSFQMGSPSGDSERGTYEDPQHRVTIARDFAVGKFEVTFEEWDACVAAGGCNSYRPDDEGWGRGKRPVINVNWDDAQSYVFWLSRKTGQTYSLLSEAEWEYAARAGTTTRYSWGNDIGQNRANCNGCGSQWDHDRTAPVGSFAANAFGLYDMHGNVWEWPEDCWKDSYAGATIDGSAWRGSDCSRRVLRGGSWIGDPWDLRSALRYGSVAYIQSSLIGFRVSRTLD